MRTAYARGALGATLRRAVPHLAVRTGAGLRSSKVGALGSAGEGAMNPLWFFGFGVTAAVFAILQAVDGARRKRAAAIASGVVPPTPAAPAAPVPPVPPV